MKGEVVFRKINLGTRTCGCTEILLNPFMYPKSGYSSEECWLTMPSANRSSKKLTKNYVLGK